MVKLVMVIMIMVIVIIIMKILTIIAVCEPASMKWSFSLGIMTIKITITTMIKKVIKVLSSDINLALQPIWGDI